jgi:hypothetical protein
VAGDFCSPLCVQNECPKGDGSFTAKPSCVLEAQGSSKPTQCALICTPGANGACPEGSACQAIQGEGICTYPSSPASGVEAKTPATFVKASALGDEDISFEEYVARHRRAYASAAERADRRTVFEATRASVAAQNAMYASGASTWWAAVNKFADRTSKEMAAVGAGMPPPAALVARHQAEARRGAQLSAHPVAKEWTKYQSPVKNQGNCGSCWAFATTEVVESHLSIAQSGATPLVLAPQTLVSCAVNPKSCGGTGGCEGATAEIGFDYVSHSGMALEEDFPYTASDSKCPSSYPKTATCAGYVKNVQNSLDVRGVVRARARASSDCSPGRAGICTPLFSRVSAPRGRALASAHTKCTLPRSRAPVLPSHPAPVLPRAPAGCLHLRSPCSTRCRSVL